MNQGDNRASQGLIDAGAGFLKWDWEKNKYVWINKDKKVSSPYKRKQPENKKIEYPKKARRSSLRLQGKHAIKPLGLHNAQQKKKSPPKKHVVSKVQPQVDLIFPVRAVKQAKATETYLKPNIQQTYDDKHEINQVYKGHDPMMNALQARCLKIKVAQAEWKQNGISGLISYLVKTNDPSVTTDFLPLLTMCIRENDKTKLSLGSCQEIIPLAEKLLTSKYEDYIVKTLDFLRVVLKIWWRDFSTYNGKQDFDVRMLRTRSIPSVYTSIVGMSDIVNKLSKRQDRIGEKARSVAVFVRQM